MAVNEDQGAPGRNADPEASTRRQIALVVSITFSVITVLVVIGGMVGRFDQTLVDVVFTALATAVGTVWVWFFRQNKAGGE